MVYTKNIEFEWNLVKAISNGVKHGISFQQAVMAFYDPYSRIELDFKHSNKDEIRRRLIGKTSDDILVVVFTIRNEKTRIISARRAKRKERIFYEENKES